MKTLIDITYDLFEIDPVSFYSTRFSSGGGKFEPMALRPICRRAIGFQKFEFLAEEIAGVLHSQTPGFSVLDIGCGSGRFGAYIKSVFPNCRLTGVDMSKACTEESLENGYDKAIQCDFIQGLPFPDDSFDFVFSMDTFGHVEFRNKDGLISEINRVTISGGRGFHGIECGDINYLNCNPKDEKDPIRRYVYIDGHIGVENLDQIYDRFSKEMTVTKAFNWQVRPLLEVENALTHSQWGEKFSEDLNQFQTPEAMLLADAVIGHINRTNIDMLLSGFGPILTQKRLDEIIPAGPIRNYVTSLLNWGGFAMISTHS
ncbi:class I SAM-dependent methyltransferase [Nitrosovibrio sp. Nv6]|uniref:class I SAM-dependent methyltransferase n=1 Tax=Nitrosovibrio sp. Nv6 TaxID=1855340 RepID=UPI0008CB5B2E|nr:class I SAM-dependent methyltransferase [Nitrosovibrio sp. Nv6]SEO84874.1 Methyltransferase domain-containing protein [Nitrosovibrio sp. Nv6]